MRNLAIFYLVRVEVLLRNVGIQDLRVSCAELCIQKLSLKREPKRKPNWDVVSREFVKFPASKNQ